MVLRPKIIPGIMEVHVKTDFTQPDASLLFLSLFTLTLLRVCCSCVVTSQRCLNRVTPLAVASDVISELLVFFPLVLHRAAAQRERPYELGQREWTLF